MQKMNILTEKEFLSKKTSDTIVIYGSGNSINKITDTQKIRLGEYNSISFNWFCKSKIQTTFYTIREQSNSPKRISSDETEDELYNLLNSYYKDSCLIVHNLSKSIHKNIVTSYHSKLDNFIQSGIVVNDIKLYMNNDGIDKWKKYNIFKDGVIHGKMTLNGILHIVSWMGYKKILFAGIDLLDSRYFWLNNKTRYTVSKKGRSCKSRHILATQTLDLIKQTRSIFGIDMATVSDKSLLIKIMEIWK